MNKNANKGSNPVQEKVKTIEELADITRAARAAGETVVLAHGTFDLVHVGHIRHLRTAKREGTILIVTLTADEFVNKGPGRPVFSEHMRAEMLATLDVVDYVGIQYAPMAIDAIRVIQPDVYIKGKEYENAEDDVTGGIVGERKAVEAHGGRIVFTDEVTFSSSSLINRHLAAFDPDLDHFLESHREKGTLDTLLNLLDKIKDYRVLVVGDAILDDYNYVSAMGKSPKEHIIATLFGKREIFAGGVFAAANHIADFCKEVEVVTAIGGDCQFEDVINNSLRSNVKLHAFRRDGKPTTRKVRFIDEAYLRKLFEVYYMDDTSTPAKMESGIDGIINDRAADFDLVIVTDFGHGFLTSSMIETLTRCSRFLAVNTQSNSANIGYNLITKYRKADYVCIDAPEARLAVTDRFSDLEQIVSEVLPYRVDCKKFIVTHGSLGCVGYESGKVTVRIPAFTKTVIDTVGAGDAFFTVTAPLVAAGGSMDQVAFIGNAVGAIKVGIVGHRHSVEKIPLIKYMTTLLK